MATTKLRVMVNEAKVNGSIDFTPAAGNLSHSSTDFSPSLTKSTDA